MSIRLLINLSLLLAVTQLCSCKPRASEIVIKEFSGGIRYETLVDVSNGSRVISHMNPNDRNAANIVIPGDVLWCEARGKYIVGEKVGAKRPASWMSPDWEKAGFFAVDSSAINPQAFSDEEKYGKAVRWFANKESLDQAVKSTSTLK